MHIDKKCVGIAEDLENYRYPEHKEGSALKQDPLKDGFHQQNQVRIYSFFFPDFLSTFYLISVLWGSNR